MLQIVIYKKLNFWEEYTPLVSWEPSDKKVCVTRKEHFLKLCQEQKSFHIFVKMFEELVYQTITRQPGLPLSMDQHDQ